MSGKTARDGKGTSCLPPLADTAANTSHDQASKNSLSKSPAKDENEHHPPAWHKVSDILLQSFNEGFDKFKQNFQKTAGL